MITNALQLAHFTTIIELALEVHENAHLGIIVTCTPEMIAMAKEGFALFGTPPNITVIEDFLGMPVNSLVFSRSGKEYDLTDEQVSTTYMQLGKLTGALARSDYAFSVGVNADSIKADKDMVAGMAAVHDMFGLVRVEAVGDVLMFFKAK